MSLSLQLTEYIRACFTGIWIESHEHADALAEITTLCRSENWQLASWDIDSGLVVPGQAAASESTGNDPLAAIRSLQAMATTDGTSILVLQNFHRFLQSAEIVQALAGARADGDRAGVKRPPERQGVFGFFGVDLVQEQDLIAETTVRGSTFRVQCGSGRDLP